MKRILISLFFLFIANFHSFAQPYLYLVNFKDKANSPYSINNPIEFLSQKSIERRFKQGIAITERDLPPNPSYIDSVLDKNVQLIYKSRWLNGILITATESQKDEILTLSIVNGIEFNRPLKQATVSSFRKQQKIESLQANYGDATAQINLLGVYEMHQQGFHGENMLIAIMDNGFQNANVISCLDTTFENNKVLEVFDFVDNDSSVFQSGTHGTSMMSCMAAYLENQLISPAYQANYVLFRTEDDASETKAEEAYWLFAAERADSLGVDIINTSLGYSTFDNSIDNYLTSQMDGNTSLITRAADFAAGTGMLIVNSAGNSGNNSWHIITAPADGDSVLAVGATDRTGNVINFSSRGNAADGDIKPDVMAVGFQTALSNIYGQITTSDGTSFSSPLTAAMAAGLWQSNPLLSAFDILVCLRKSGHIYESPNVNYGYGLANFIRADSVAKNEFKIRSFETTNELISIKLIPDNKTVLSLNFENVLVGHKLRISIIDLQNKTLIKQDELLINSTLFETTLPINELNSNVLMRIDDITEAKNIGLFLL